MKIGRFTISWHSICWVAKGNSYPLHPHRIDHYFCWWNWLDKDIRYWGFEQDWYDGPLSSFGFWFFNWSWDTPWTKVWKNTKIK